MFKRVAIIGYGLIGSSIGRAIMQKNLADHLIAVDLSDDVCKTVVEMQLAHEATSSLQDGVRDCDLIILAVPVLQTGNVVAAIKDHLADGVIISDTGSVKQSVIDDVMPQLPPHAHFIPAHPIAGTEYSGPEAGFPELFESRWCIFTPTEETDVRAVEKVTLLWEQFGADIEIMDAKRHDLVLGLTSHLPHLIAYTIVGTAVDLEDFMGEDVISFSAGGFRDFTRIAASDPVMWRDIFLTNKDAVLDLLQRFNEDLTALQRAIRNDDPDFLEDFFTRTRDVRRKIIDRGQASYPRSPIGSNRYTPRVRPRDAEPDSEA